MALPVELCYEMELFVRPILSHKSVLWFEISFSLQQHYTTSAERDKAS